MKYRFGDKSEANNMNAREKAEDLLARYHLKLRLATSWSKKKRHIMATSFATDTIEEIKKFCGEHTFYRDLPETQLGVKCNKYWDRVIEILNNLPEPKEIKK